MQVTFLSEVSLSGIIHRPGHTYDLPSHIATAMVMVGWAISAAGCCNVMDFGAVGNRVTDDTAAINAAIVASGASGLPVFLPPLSYRINDSIRAVQGTTLFGVNGWRGDKNTQIYNYGTGPAILATGSGDRSYIQIKDIYIDGITGAADGVYLDGAHRAVIENVRVRRCAAGIKAAGVSCLFNRCFIEGCVSGVVFEDCSNFNEFYRCYIAGNATGAYIPISTGEYIFFRSCEFSLNTIQDMHISNKHIVVRDGWFEGSPVCIKYDGIRYAQSVVEGCHFSSYTNHAIHSDGASTIMLNECEFGATVTHDILLENDIAYVVIKNPYSVPTVSAPEGSYKVINDYTS